MATMATRYNSEEGEGGGGYFYELLMALHFLNKKLFELTFLRKINWRYSYEKIIRFYFLYEILKESIFYKKIS